MREKGAAVDREREARIERYHRHKSIAGRTRTWSLPLSKVAKIAALLLAVAYVVGELI